MENINKDLISKLNFGLFNEAWSKATSGLVTDKLDTVYLDLNHEVEWKLCRPIEIQMIKAL